MRDTLRRLDGLFIGLAEQVQQEYEAWQKSLSRKALELHIHDVISFARVLSLSLEQLKAPSSPVEEKKREALSHYALALWRARELEAAGHILPLTDERVDTLWEKSRELVLEIEERLASLNKAHEPEE